jgi:hypothetical protein
LNVTQNIEKAGLVGSRAIKPRTVSQTLPRNLQHLPG